MAGYIIATIVPLIIGFVLYMNWKVNKQGRALDVARYERIKPLMDKIDQGDLLTTGDIRPFAFDLATREATYQLLDQIGNLELFPSELVNFEKAAEARLANWLEFPTELDALPDDIEHIKTVSVPLDDQQHARYLVLKFRKNEPHWAAKEGWLLGVVGPYFSDSKPYDFPSATFSRFSSKLGSITPEEEVKWVHEHLATRA
ncbi:MAG: hypothetical protein QM762_24350 [Chryseolinea sp.]